MRAFADYNPIVLAVYFLTAAGIAMFCMNPFLLSLSLIGALSLFLMQNGRRRVGIYLALFGLFMLSALANPLFTHNGVTVLFVLNDEPVTAEALLYGITAAGMIVSILYWFSSFTRIMSSDKLLYLLGSLSPKLALVLSMSLRYAPLFRKQAQKINRAQIALGLYKEDNVIDRARGGLRVFSVMVTWALENGVITAESMSARGYGVGKRTHFSVFRFRKEDGFLILLTLALGIVSCVCIGIGAMDFVFYPAVRMAEISPAAIAGYLSYGILALLPTMLEAEGRMRWKYLRSRI